MTGPARPVLDKAPDAVATTAAARAVVAALVAGGVRHLVLAPGSRSTALVIAAMKEPELTVHVVIDERDAAFFALGVGRASGAPAAVLTTSGTATANLFPAVMEADIDEVPLVVLTADRPAELLYSGANQTVDQVKLFSDRVRAFAELPAAPAHVDDAAATRIVLEVVRRATSERRGPVHLNVRLRKPFEPGASMTMSHDAGHATLPRVRRSVAAIDDATRAFLDDTVAGAERGLLVIGRLEDEAEQRAARRIARELGWPAYADVLSGLRVGPTSPAVIGELELLLASERAKEMLAPDVVIHLGKGLVSGRMQSFLADKRPRAYVQLGAHTQPHDPNHVVTDRVLAPLSTVSFAAPPPLSAEGVERKDALAAYAAMAREAADAYCEERALHEPSVSALLSALAARDDEALFVSSSMPVRDLDRFGHATVTDDDTRAPLPVFANRGASGIDGVIASALGASVGLSRPLTLLIGDVALLHDAGALLALRELAAPVRVVVVNNQGGGIFSFLPVAGEDSVFERCFGTPHAVDLAALAQAYGIAHHRVESRDGLHAAWDATRDARPTLIEVMTDREENLALHRRIDRSIDEGAGVVYSRSAKRGWTWRA